MKVRLLLVGRSERGWVTEGLEHYVGRLGRMFPVELVVLPEAGKGQASYQQRVESERILAALKPGERVAAGHEREKPSPAQRSRSSWVRGEIRAFGRWPS